MTLAVLSLGSNLGDRVAHLRGAVERLAAMVEVLEVSPVYETPPWGDPDQPPYLNAVIRARAASPDVEHGHWLQIARDLEARAGRVRDPARRYGPRTLDVDVIAIFGAGGEPVTVDDPELTVPHPLAHVRAFVLRPWLDIEPEAMIVGCGRVSDLIQDESISADLAALRPYDAEQSVERGVARVFDVFVERRAYGKA